jgi:uncharacterized delta-60 repeat protein
MMGVALSHGVSVKIRALGTFSISLAAVTSCGGSQITLTAIPIDAAAADAVGANVDAGGQIASFNPALDPSFATLGTISGALSNWTPSGVAVDAQGRVVLSGPSDPLSEPPADIVLRLTEDGVLDTTFAQSGREYVPVDAAVWGQAVGLLDQDAIAVLGAAEFQGQPGAFGVRLSPDGAPDPTFSLGSGLLSSGQFTAGLWRSDGSGFLLGTNGVARFTVSGDLDVTFGTNGLIPQADCGAAAADGTLWTASGRRLSRFQSNGTLDGSFGTAGNVDLSSLGLELTAVHAVVLRPQGGAVVVGSHVASGAFEVDILALTQTGSVDPAYAAGLPVSVQSAGAPVGAAQTPDGRTFVWTTNGGIIELGVDGSASALRSLSLGGTVMAATLDGAERLVVVALDATNPFDSTWDVQRYLTH